MGFGGDYNLVVGEFFVFYGNCVWFGKLVGVYFNGYFW